MPAKFRKSILMSAALSICFGIFSVEARSQQTVQTNQSDLDFVNRLASETERMQQQVRELSSRVSALEAPAVAPLETDMVGQSQAPTAQPGLQRERAVNAEEFERIKATLGSIDYKVVQERRRVDAAGSDDTDQQTIAVSNLRILADELQDLEEVVSRLEMASR